MDRGRRQQRFRHHRPIADRPNPQRPVADRPNPQRPVADRPNHQRPIADRPNHQRRNGYKFTASRLQNLLSKDPTEITLGLASKLPELNELLNEAMDYCLAELLVSILRRSLQSVSLKEKNNQILSLLLHSNFPMNISQMILKINVSNKGQVEFLQNLLYILKTILTHNPSEYISILQITGAMNILLQNQDEGGEDDVRDLLVDYRELQDLLQALTVAQRKKDTQEVLPSLIHPPEDFRNLEMMPTAAAIHSEERVFLRENKVKGAYDNVDHYLDVQFRLMREDFFGPLRDGIKQYLRLENGQKDEHIDDLRIYNQVHILHSFCTTNGIAYKVCFDVSNMQVKWQQSKRLIFGSLVCLTPDDFQTVYFASVTERKAEELEKGLVDLIFFAPCEDISRISSRTVFIMAETMAYFEAYRPVLTALKEITEDNMPFQDYIIYGKSDVSPPKYLTQQRPLRIDLTCITDERKLVYDSQKNIVKLDENLTNNLSLNILHDTWPSAKVLKLNDSQHEALQNALTKEFSLTQGPPGTGKTYIGLKIVKALCYNSDMWHMNGKSPMLIVCYTNQALDKFLEGIASFLEGGILRVGGRSSSEDLSNYLLKEVRTTYRKEKRFTNEFIKTKYSTINDKIELEAEIEEITNRIKLTKKGILRDDVLENHMGRFHDWLVKGFEHEKTARKDGSKISVLIHWLGYGNFDIRMDAEDPLNVDRGGGGDAYTSVQDPMGEVKEQLEDLYNKDDMFTDTDFIQKNRMMDDDDDLGERFSAMGIVDDDGVALKLDDFDRGFSSDDFEITRDEKKRLKNQLQKDLASNTFLEEEAVDQIRPQDMWHMSKQKRWQLYRRWVASYCQQLRDQLVQKEIKYNDLSKAYKELQHYEDGVIMKNSLVIGMTTTGAAKYHALLQEIKPRIIIVEEAAEILEAHVVSALNPMCEHLILIGDHKQLRPNPNVYKLARNYNLEVSLFERMVLNKCHVKCLTHQHRMRPEISQLLRPIYSDLEDHDSVTKYENVKGLGANMYFIQHNEHEKTSKEGRSYNNPHEASFVVELCKYLLKQGYSQSQITILTTYTAQLFQLRNFMKNTAFKGVKMTVVDNYQGEENDIVLLSLVRSNAQRKVGFLKTDNRVCVALSRAKIGFYVIGNFEILSEQSKLWNSILLMLKSKGLVGPAITLCCQKHPTREIQVREKSDFAQTPEGGCLKPCEGRLDCGHTCKRLCHPVNDHDEYKCLVKCTKMAPGCPENHQCTHICSKECPPCTVRVANIMPDCNHRQMMACSQDLDTFICQEACEKLLPCGHQCKEKCGSSCTNRCSVRVNKTFPCKHTVETPCYNESCTEACSKRLDCGHQCRSICGTCSEKRIHSTCSEGCRRILVCGHQCSSKQCNVCLPCVKPCQNRCVHNKCMKNCGDLCVPCIEPCQWSCKHYRCRKYCHESCDRPKCDKPCLKRLKRCGHQCVGLCGEKCPRLCRVCNEKELTEIFFGTENDEDASFVELGDCGHIFEKNGLDAWMSQETDGEIQLKVCPRCKVPIRRNLRYGQIINKTLTDIDMVKKKLIGDKKQIKVVILQYRKERVELTQDYKRYLRPEWTQIENLQSPLPVCNSFISRVSFLSALCRFMKKDVLKEDSSLQKHCRDLAQWLLYHREIFSKTELEETETEVKRIGKILEFYEAKRKVKNISISEQSNADSFIAEGLRLLTCEDYSLSEGKVSVIEERLRGIIPVISEKEKISIVKAIGLTPGHWFKCPKGHIYAIGDCGGATERGKCPECGSTIGGSNHRLDAGNRLAGEMDGARHAAWSEEANMGNYNFD